MGITEAITASKACIEVCKLARDLISHPDVQPEKVRNFLQEVMVHLTNTQTGLAEAQLENMILHLQLDSYNAQKQIQEDMEFRLDGQFYVRKSEAQKGLIAYCPICWQKDRVTVPLRAGTAPGCYKCDVHNLVYTTSDYRKAFKSRKPRRPCSSSL